MTKLFSLLGVAAAAVWMAAVQTPRIDRTGYKVRYRAVFYSILALFVALSVWYILTRLP